MNASISQLSLAEVRRHLEELVERRLLGPLSPWETRRWAQLTELEDRLLGAGQGAATSAPACP